MGPKSYPYNFSLKHRIKYPDRPEKYRVYLVLAASRGKIGSCMFRNQSLSITGCGWCFPTASNGFVSLTPAITLYLVLMRSTFLYIPPFNPPVGCVSLPVPCRLSIVQRQAGRFLPNLKLRHDEKQRKRSAALKIALTP